MRKHQRSEEHASSKKKHLREVNEVAPETITLTRKSIVGSLGMPHLYGTAQWKAIMKRFTQSCKETCKAAAKDMHDTMTPVNRSMKTFPTGSNYLGTWNKFGMSGEGTYTFPGQGVRYKGGFEDGVFHGEGELQYESGTIIRGKWSKGKIVEKYLFFDDGLEYVEQDWAYCRPSDRRYTIEYDNGIQPASMSYLTADQPPLPIPPGYYDVGDGFYEPSTKTVYKYGDLTAISRAPDIREQKWTENNCRVNPDLPKGPCPFLYEGWVEPTLLAPTIPLPQLRCNTYSNLEQEDESAVIWQHHSRTSRGQGIFASRIGFGSTTDFYDVSLYGGHLVLSEARRASRKRSTKVSAVGFRTSAFRFSQMVDDKDVERDHYDESEIEIKNVKSSDIK